MKTFKRPTDNNVCSTELRAFLCALTTKQTVQCQSADDELQTCEAFSIFLFVVKIYDELIKKA